MKTTNTTNTMNENKMKEYFQDCSIQSLLVLAVGVVVGGLFLILCFL